MPELPEVETIRRGLAKRIVGKQVESVEVRQPRLVRGSPYAVEETLTGQVVRTVGRRGKLLILQLDDPDRYLLVHLKMTGQLIYVNETEVMGGGHPYPSLQEALPSKYSHIIVTFVDGSRLYFNDMRQFGYMRMVDAREKERALAQFGPEPLTKAFDWEGFRATVARRSAPLKAALLDQKVVAGLGNIYVDEVCFLSGVRPDRPANTLAESEARAVWERIPEVLAEAIGAGGTTFQHFRDDGGARGNYTDRLRVYGRGGERCLVCGSVLEKGRVAGRGTVWCPRCQR